MRPTDASARPYTGHIALPLKPYAENRRVNLSIVSGLTTSDPLNARRQLLRSSLSISGSGILRTDRSNAKLGAGETVPRWRWMAHSQRSGRARNASGDMSTAGTPK